MLPILPASIRSLSSIVSFVVTPVFRPERTVTLCKEHADLDQKVCAENPTARVASFPDGFSVLQETVTTTRRFRAVVRTSLTYEDTLPDKIFSPGHQCSHNRIMRVCCGHAVVSGERPYWFPYGVGLQWFGLPGQRDDSEFKQAGHRSSPF